ncbi:MAG: hypothetical protein NZ518_12010, partial [Dehalococcoidia bacterium]|nr:hypothetical protein [Dehalococcoidia bacterium]
LSVNAKLAVVGALCAIGGAALWIVTATLTPSDPFSDPPALDESAFYVVFFGAPVVSACGVAGGAVWLRRDRRWAVAGALAGVLASCVVALILLLLRLPTDVPWSALPAPFNRLGQMTIFTYAALIGVADVLAALLLGALLAGLLTSTMPPPPRGVPLIVALTVVYLAHATSLAVLIATQTLSEALLDGALAPAAFTGTVAAAPLLVLLLWSVVAGHPLGRIAQRVWLVAPLCVWLGFWIGSMALPLAPSRFVFSG